MPTILPMGTVTPFFSGGVSSGCGRSRRSKRPWCSYSHGAFCRAGYSPGPCRSVDTPADPRTAAPTRRLRRRLPARTVPPAARTPRGGPSPRRRSPAARRAARPLVPGSPAARSPPLGRRSRSPAGSEGATGLRGSRRPPGLNLRRAGGRGGAAARGRGGRAGRRARAAGRTHAPRYLRSPSGGGRAGGHGRGACGRTEDNGRPASPPQRHLQGGGFPRRSCVQLPPHKERWRKARFKKGPRGASA